MPDEKVRFTRTQLQQYDRYRRARDILREGESEIQFEDTQLAKAIEKLKAQLSEGGKAAVKEDSGKKNAA